MTVRSEIDALAAELLTLLDAELGTFSNGQRALWKGSRIPIELKTTGLQLAIEPFTGGEVKQLSANQVYRENIWTIVLVNFAVDTKVNFAVDTKLWEAVRKIEARYVLAGRSRYVPATDLVLEQCKVFVYRPAVVNRS